MRPDPLFSMAHLIRCAAFAWCCTATVSTAQNVEKYPLLDHVQGTLVQTAAAPVRPVLIDAAKEVWAVNTDLSTVEHFAAIDQSPLAEGPLEILHVPWGPVSIAEWDDPRPSVGAELLVVCRNTWGVVRIDKASGAYKEFIPLPAEPSDIVVDSRAGRAFVSCTGADAVVRIDLALRDGRFHELYDEVRTGGALRLKSPYFLALESSGNVRVAPLHSGNNTTVTGTQFEDVDVVISVAGRTVLDPSTGNPVAADLPDEDLFEIDPLESDLTMAVSVVATGVGTLLFQHGRNPVDGRYWILNTDARNADPRAQSEPLLEFDFVDNRATSLGPPHGVVGFDPDSGGFDIDSAIGQPFSLAFLAGGELLVTGLLTDNLTMLDSAGGVRGTLALPDGSIPRGLAVLPGEPSLVVVHCWGTSRIEVVTASSSGTLTSVGHYSLSDDPLTPDLEEGRRIFFDGDRSARGNVSCASCHVDGGTDFLAWNLSGLPFDDKGPMVTQTLIGLERVSPFHWRGERTFEDFNTFAFPGLLGNPDPRDPEGPPVPLDPVEFAKLKAWLFSLRNPANPFQNRARVVDGDMPTELSPSTFIPPTQTRIFRSDLTALAALDPGHPLVTDVPDGRGGTVPNPMPWSAVGGDAVVGLSRWQGDGRFGPEEDDLIFQGRWKCVQCHAFPNGTDNDVTDDEGQTRLVLLPERLHFKNAPFHEIWRKKQSLVAVDTTANGSSDPSLIDVRTILGTGVQHAGNVPDVLRFAQIAGSSDDDSTEFALTTSSLVQQWDQGLAPAAHFAFWLSAAQTSATITGELVDFLLWQASDTANQSTNVPNCDIAVIQSVAGSRRAWYLDRTRVTSPVISPNDPVFTDDSDLNGTGDHKSLQWFIDQAKRKVFTIPPTPLVPSLVVGLPVGMAERFAVDWDMDGKKNKDEAPGLLFVVDPAPDTVAPLVESSDVGYVTTNTARVYVRTDEPATLSVSYNEVGSGARRTVVSPLLSRVHALVLPDLRPSTSPKVTTNDDDPSIDPQVTPEQVEYEWRIDATDASGNQSSTTVAATLSTAPFSLPFGEDSPAANIAPVVQMRHEHVLRAPLAVDVSTESGGTRLVTVDLSAFLKQGAAMVPAERRVFVVRAFRVRGSDAPNPLTVANGGLVSAEAGTRFVNLVALNAGGPDVFLKHLGGLIVNEVPTVGNGDATLSFRVDGVTVIAGDELIVNLEGVFESTTTPPTFLNCTPTSCARITISVPASSAMSQWDFPRTKEANFQGRATAP